MLASLTLLASLMMAQDGQALLQSCTLEESGWVCRYRVPEGAQQPSQPAIIKPGPPPADARPSLPNPNPPSNTAIDDAEQLRQEKLVRRCADASWMSLCTPGDRKEAKALKDAVDARAKLKLEVAGLAADGKCAEAVKAALQAGEIALARDIKTVCEPAK